MNTHTISLATLTLLSGAQLFGALSVLTDGPQISVADGDTAVYDNSSPYWNTSFEKTGGGTLYFDRTNLAGNFFYGVEGTTIVDGRRFSETTISMMRINMAGADSKLEIKGGATVSTGVAHVTVVGGMNGSGEMLVDGAGTYLKNGNGMFIGYSSEDWNMVSRNGDGTDRYDYFTNPAYGAKGVVTVDNGATIEIGATNLTQSAGRNLRIGYDYDGVMNVQNGSTVLARGDTIVGFYRPLNADLGDISKLSTNAELNVTGGSKFLGGDLDGTTSGLNPSIYAGYSNGTVGRVLVDGDGSEIIMQSVKDGATESTISLAAGYVYASQNLLEGKSASETPTLETVEGYLTVSNNASATADNIRIAFRGGRVLDGADPSYTADLTAIGGVVVETGGTLTGRDYISVGQGAYNLDINGDGVLDYNGKYQATLTVTGAGSTVEAPLINVGGKNSVEGNFGRMYLYDNATVKASNIDVYANGTVFGDGTVTVSNAAVRGTGRVVDNKFSGGSIQAGFGAAETLTLGDVETQNTVFKFGIYATDQMDLEGENSDGITSRVIVESGSALNVNSSLFELAFYEGDSGLALSDMKDGSSFQFFVIEEGSSIVGSFAVDKAALDALLADGLEWDFTRLTSTGYAYIVAVPEAATCSLIFASLALAFAAYRRRK